MNKLIAIILGIVLIIIGSILRYSIVENALQNVAKTGETSCIRGNLERIKPIAQCEEYKLKIESIENPNCYSGKTTYPVIITMQEAKKNGCTVD